MRRAHHKIISCLLVALSLVAATTGCETLSILRPALTAAALTLLHELDALLQQYENSHNPAIEKSLPIPADSKSQDALYREIVELLDLCHAQVPAKTLRPFRARLDAASRRAP